MLATVRVLGVIGLVTLAVFLPADARAKNPSCRFTLNIPTLHMFPLFQHLKGDPDMQGGSPSIDLKAVLQGPDPTDGGGAKKLRLDLDVRIADFKGDGTTFQDRKVFWIADRWIRGGSAADLRRCLDTMFEDCVRIFKKDARSEQQLRAQCARAARWEVDDTLTADAGTKGRQWTVYRKKSAKLVTSAECIGDVSGADTGKIGCKNITFRPRIKIDVTFGKKALAR